MSSRSRRRQDYFTEYRTPYQSTPSRDGPSIGRDGALRRPRRVQRRNERCDPPVTRDSFRPLNAGGDIAARCPYQRLVRSTSIPYISTHGNPTTQNFAAPNSVVG